MQQITLDRITEALNKAREAATMGNMSLGFPDDRIEVKSVHFGDDLTGRVGDVLHPNDYVKRITDLYRDTWIIGPIDEAIRIVEANRALLRQCERLRDLLEDSGLTAALELARAGMPA